MAIQTASDIKKSVLFRCGELTDGTSPYDSKALEYMNQIYRSILSGGNEFNLDLGKPWSFAKSTSPGTLILKPSYSTGTITCNNGNRICSLSGIPPMDLTGQWIHVNQTGDYYRIAEHTSTVLYLDAPFTDDSIVGASFVVYFLEYDLSPSIWPLVNLDAIERLTGPMVVDKQQRFNAPLDGLIYGVDISNINENYPLKFIDEVIPTAFSQLYRTPDGKIRVRFNSQVGSETRVSFDYIPIYSNLVDSTSYSTNGVVFTCSSPHNLRTGDPIAFLGTAPTGLSNNAVYYVCNPQASGLLTKFTIARTRGGKEFQFFTIPPGSTETGSFSSVAVLPPAFNQILEYGASFYLLTDKNDERSQQYGQLAAQKMQALIDSNSREMAQTGGMRYAGMIPRLDNFSGPRRYWRQSAT